jgi:hypothetical protein
MTLRQMIDVLTLLLTLQCAPPYLRLPLELMPGQTIALAATAAPQLVVLALSPHRQLSAAVVEGSGYRLPLHA